MKDWTGNSRTAFTTLGASNHSDYERDDAKASIKNHPDEWRTILNYDWSKGEEDEDED